MKFNTYLALLLTGSLVSCGGGGGSTAGGNSSSAPGVSAPPKATVAQGMVTGFGSVIVNGVHYDVKDASIDVDGTSKVESELGVGEMVHISGTLDADGIHGKAAKLVAESQLRGPIDSIDLANGVIVALGQTILITADTFFQDGKTAASLKVGDVVKVSSYTNADGALVATRIEIKLGSEATEILLTGKVANLDTTAMTFTLNGTTVDYSKATLSDLPNQTIANDLMVRVHGTMVNGVFVANGNVKGSSLDLRHDHDLDTKAGFEIGGLVSDVVPSTSFKLGDTTVLVSSNTKVEGGVLADIANGIIVKVHGSLDADKNVVAANLKLILQPKIEDEGLITGTDTIANTFSLNGVTFEVTVDTSFNDRGIDKVRLFSLKDLHTGDFVNVRGYRIAATDTAAARLVATRVERKKLEEKGKDGFKTEISGIIESATTDTITLDGHTIKINPNTLIPGFASIQAFLDAAVGLNVEIKGVVEASGFYARSIIVDGHEIEIHHSKSTSSESHSVVDGHSSSSAEAHSSSDAQESSSAEAQSSSSSSAI